MQQYKYFYAVWLRADFGYSINLLCVTNDKEFT